MYNIQEQILNNLQTVKMNTWPVEDVNIPVEPYLYTDGSTYEDIDSIPYVGYYYIMSQTGGDIAVSGRTVADGHVTATGSPATDRYLTPITTG